MACSTNTQDLDINASVGFDLFLIAIAEFSHLLPLYFSIGNVDVFRGDIYMFEEIVVHVIVVRVRITGLDGIVLVQVESYHIFEAKLTTLMEADELPIDPQGTTASGKSEDAGVS